jgi:major type 1 subunit fimbrin (pilin)
LNSTGSADKVQLELLNSNNSTINVAAAPWAQGVTSFFTTGNTGVGTANFAVRYYATGVATPGDVISAVTYSMSYL